MYGWILYHILWKHAVLLIDLFHRTKYKHKTNL